MKTRIHSTALLIFFTLFLGVSHAQAQEINEEYKTKYWTESILLLHGSNSQEFINTALRQHDCLESEFNYEITTRSHQGFFRDTSGEVIFSLKTKCFDPDLLAIHFYFNPGGYDEDYGDLKLQIITTSGTFEQRVCSYGLHEGLRTCPQEITDTSVLSTGTVSR